MKIFDKKGMLIIPNPMKTSKATGDYTLVINEVFCPNGHALINPKINFDGYPGIFFKVSSPIHQGFVALSPIIGQNVRVALDIDLISGEIMELRCPQCDILLPVHSPCSCGGNLITLFLTKACNFNDSVGICNRVDCKNFHIIQSGELINVAKISQL